MVADMNQSRKIQTSVSILQNHDKGKMQARDHLERRHQAAAPGARARPWPWPGLARSAARRQAPRRRGTPPLDPVLTQGQGPHSGRHKFLRPQHVAVLMVRAL